MRPYLILFILLLTVGACQSDREFLFEREYESLEGTGINIGKFKNRGYTLFVSFANNCPVCKASIPELQQLAKHYPEVGQVLFYPANQKDTAINAFIADLLPEHTVCVKDRNKYLTRYFEATVTPHAFITDSLGQVVYRGAISNSVFGNYRKNYAKRESYLARALDTLIHHQQALKRYETKAVGCYIE